MRGKTKTAVTINPTIRVRIAPAGLAVQFHQARRDDALLFFDEAVLDAIPVDEGDEEWMW
jgi:hypothetical protein